MEGWGGVYGEPESTQEPPATEPQPGQRANQKKHLKLKTIPDSGRIFPFLTKIKEFPPS